MDRYSSSRDTSTYMDGLPRSGPVLHHDRQRRALVGLLDADAHSLHRPVQVAHLLARQLGEPEDDAARHHEHVYGTR